MLRWMKRKWKFKKDRKKGREKLEKPKRIKVCTSVQFWKIKRKVWECSPTKPIYRLIKRTRMKITIIEFKLCLEETHWA